MVLKWQGWSFFESEELYLGTSLEITGCLVMILGTDYMITVAVSQNRTIQVISFTERWPLNGRPLKCDTEGRDLA